MSSEYDEAFRALMAAHYFVEGFNGRAALVSIDMTNIESASLMLNSMGEPVPSQGLYTVHIDALGIIVVFGYDDSEDRAADWREYVSTRPKVT
jgi:hypothetical protein